MNPEVTELARLPKTVHFSPYRNSAGMLCSIVPENVFRFLCAGRKVWSFQGSMYSQEDSPVCWIRFNAPYDKVRWEVLMPDFTGPAMEGIGLDRAAILVHEADRYRQPSYGSYAHYSAEHPAMHEDDDVALGFEGWASRAEECGS